MEEYKVTNLDYCVACSILLFYFVISDVSHRKSGTHSAQNFHFSTWTIMTRCSPFVHLTWQDLSKLNRNPAKVLYLSGHALEGCLQPENCVPIKPWKQQDIDDTALLDFIPFLECKLSHKICSTRNPCLKLLLWHFIHAKIALSPSFSMRSCCP